jgi:predicted amidophosphoribosyltransferase
MTGNSESVCPIYYEEITPNVNNCVTTCGHKFCFNCLMLALQKNKNCPCCREPLQKNIKCPGFVIYDNDDTYEEGDSYDTYEEGGDNYDSHEEEGDMMKKIILFFSWYSLRFQTDIYVK